MRYGFADVVEQTGLVRFLPRFHAVPETIVDKRGYRPLHLRLALQELGPTFIKLGQVLSTRPDILPEDYITELANLQEHVPPFPFEEARAIVSEEFGAPLEELFRDFSPKPVASASLAQVHYAVTKSGKEVAVKVQRPRVKEVIGKDITVLRQLAEWAQKNTQYGRIYDLPGVVDQLERTINEELDFNLERRRMEAIGRNLKEFSRVRVPRVWRRLSARRVLTMERVQGLKIGEIGSLKVDRAAVAEQFLHAYLKQMVVDGLFHADPHPGNMILEPNGTVVLVDFGMVGTLDNETRRDIVRLLLAFSEQKSDEVASLMVRMGQVSDRFDIRGFKSDIASVLGRYYDAPMEEIRLGDLMVETIKLALRYGIKTPASLSLLGKTLLYIDSISRAIWPAASPLGILRSYAQRLIVEEMRAQFSPGTLIRAFLDTNEFALAFPGKLNEVMDKLSEDRLRIQYEHVGLEGLYSTLNIIANRVAFSVVVAALTISSAMLMGIKAGPTIFDLSVLGLAGFLLAAVLGTYLVYTILRSHLL